MGSYISCLSWNPLFIFSSMTTVEFLKSQVDRLSLEVHSLKSEAGAENISVGNYLLTRLAQLHVTVRTIPACLPYHCLIFNIVDVWCTWWFQPGFFGKLISNNTIYFITIRVYRTWSKTTLISTGLETGILFGTFVLYYRLNLDCTSNELNAAYAADGYARVKEGSLGAVTTTSVSCSLFIPNAKLSTGLVSANCLL